MRELSRRAALERIAGSGAILLAGLAGVRRLAEPAWAARRQPSPDPAFRRIRLAWRDGLERLEVAYFVRGRYSLGALDRIDRLMRDRRSGEVAVIDPELVDRLWWIQQMAGPDEHLHVTSGYRDEASNTALADEGAARNSLHLQARAADITLPGVPARRLADLAFTLSAHFGRGGVGYYPKRNFVHVDTGEHRHWRG